MNGLDSSIPYPGRSVRRYDHHPIPEVNGDIILDQLGAESAIEGMTHRIRTVTPLLKGLFDSCHIVDVSSLLLLYLRGIKLTGPVRFPMRISISITVTSLHTFVFLVTLRLFSPALRQIVHTAMWIRCRKRQ